MTAKFTDSKCFVMDHSGEWVEIDCETSEPIRESKDGESLLEAERGIAETSKGSLGTYGSN